MADRLTPQERAARDRQRERTRYALEHPRPLVVDRELARDRALCDAHGVNVIDWSKIPVAKPDDARRRTARCSRPHWHSGTGPVVDSRHRAAQRPNESEWCPLRRGADRRRIRRRRARDTGHEEQRARARRSGTAKPSRPAWSTRPTPSHSSNARRCACGLPDLEARSTIRSGIRAGRGAPVGGTEVTDPIGETVAQLLAVPFDGDPAELLDELYTVLTDYIVFPTMDAATAFTLWIAATHAQGAWEHATRFVIKSPIKRCGKTRAQESRASWCTTRCRRRTSPSPRSSTRSTRTTRRRSCSTKPTRSSAARRRTDPKEPKTSAASSTPAIPAVGRTSGGILPTDGVTSARRSRWHWSVESVTCPTRSRTGR